MTEATRRGALPRRRSTVVDISGPVPQRAILSAERKARSEERVVSSLPVQRPVPTPMSRLPRDLDPFEADFPWIGWSEPRHDTFVQSETRSPTFERDLNRVLAIFAN